MRGGWGSERRRSDQQGKPHKEASYLKKHEASMHARIEKKTRSELLPCVFSFPKLPHGDTGKPGPHEEDRGRLRSGMDLPVQIDP